MHSLYNPIGANRYDDLKDWALNEYENGNRIKASRINRVAEKRKPKGYRWLGRPPIYKGSI